jgi:hypothetical protein
MERKIEKAIDEFMIAFDKFFKSRVRNTWIHCDYFKVYVRKGIHCINGVAYRFIDIATINVEKKYQGRGIFTSILQLMTEKYPNENIFIESVQNFRVEIVANKFGFKKQDGDENSFNLYKLCNNQKLQVKNGMLVSAVIK